MITLTERAISKIKDISKSEGFAESSVRLRVIGGGCAGFSYDMYFEDIVNAMDEVTEIDGVKVVVDPLSLQYLDGVEVDYVDNNISAGFKFINPNVTGSCGCGSSFSA